MENTEQTEGARPSAAEFENAGGEILASTGLAHMADKLKGAAMATNTPAPNIGHPTGGLAVIAALYRTDPEKEEKGAWMTLAENVRWRVRSSQSPTAMAVAKELLAPFRAAMSVGVRLSGGQNEAFETAFVARGLVTEWENMDDGGERVACDPGNVSLIIGGQGLPALRRLVINFSEQLENYRPDPPAK